MNEIKLSQFKGADDRERFAAALSYMRERPGMTLFVEPGEYVITTPLARETMNNAITGKFGTNPEDVMFKPDFRYDRGLDFSGHISSRIIADGVTLMIDGFMEPVSVRDCSGVEIVGLTIDHVRKPYTKGRIISWTTLDRDENTAEILVDFPENFPINPDIIYPRYCTYVPDKERFGKDFGIRSFTYIDDHRARFVLERSDKSFVGNELYLWHSFHSRPAVLIENAKDTVLRDVTIHSQPGMGIVGQKAENILIERLRVIPSVGDHISTNTDATHFASCRGLLRLDGCEFEGQGDDSINVHTYYYTVISHEGERCRLQIKAPTGTHAQSLDYPEIGDKLELTDKKTLLSVGEYRVVDCRPDFEGFFCDVVLDRALPDDLDDYFIADPDELPVLEFVNCRARNHYARSILIKCRSALIENCTVSDVFECAVKIAAEAWWHEGISTADVTVRRCRFINCGRRLTECGGVYVRMDCEDSTTKAHGLVTIEDNIIECPEAHHGIVVKNTKQAIVRRNHIVSAKQNCCIEPGVGVL